MTIQPKLLAYAPLSTNTRSTRSAGGCFFKPTTQNLASAAFASSTRLRYVSDARVVPRVKKRYIYNFVPGMYTFYFVLLQ